MCYSAQLQAAYLKYLRETGAQMDLDQFVEIFGARVSDSSIRIPRAEDLDELVDVHLGTGLAQVLEVGGLDLGGVAHGAILRAPAARRSRRRVSPALPPPSFAPPAGSTGP
jgi:hypothetical protein